MAKRKWQDMKPQKVLVIGGLGFIGYHIVNELKQQGFEVEIASRKKKLKQIYKAPVVQVELPAMSDEELLEVLSPYNSIIFAGGADDRSIPQGDVDEFFYNGNVRPCLRIAQLSHKLPINKMIILGSYFSHFARSRPDWKMIERHPYLKSRLQQLEKTIEAASEKLHVSCLEIPYVFGSTPGLTPLWKPLVEYIAKSPIVFYTKGGTNMVAVEQVAQAIAGMLKTKQRRDHWLMVGDNLSWKQLIDLISSAAGKKKTVISLPNFVVRIAALFTKFYFRLKGKNSGLDPYHFIETQTAETFLYDEESPLYLKYDKSDIAKSVGETVRACDVG
ncbi:NAD(P)-dependent oxidoreductase [Chitinophagales bacterium]|nr:NAD(P)-dependent oxidoreductase [Chitinophagales bacterium]